MCTFSFPALLTRNWLSGLWGYKSSALLLQGRSRAHCHIFTPSFLGHKICWVANLWCAQSVASVLLMSLRSRQVSICGAVIPRIKQILRFGTGEEGPFWGWEWQIFCTFLFITVTWSFMYQSSRSCGETSWSRDFSGRDQWDPFFHCSLVLSQSWCNFRLFSYFHDCCGNSLENLKVVARRGSSLLCCCTLI